MTAKRNYAPLDSDELVPTANLGTGTPDGTKFLRDDQTFAVPSGTGVTDHGALTGLADDDHPQYATDSDLSTHAGAADPHTGYQKESEKDAANGYAGLNASAIVPIAHLATGTPDGTKFVRDDNTLGVPSGSGAPSDVDYLVGTAAGGLSAEIVVGTTPGGELGGTWASPTVDATHAGSTHVALGTTPSTQAFGDSAAGGSDATASKNDHKHAWPALGTTAAAIGTSAGGSATTPSKSDHVHATGAGTPSTQAFGDAAATGSGPAAAMTDHKHAMPTAFAGFSGCKVKNSGTQSRATNTVFLWDQEDYDTDAYHDTSSNTGNLVAPATGKYSVGAFIKSNGTITAGKYILYLQVNGADLPVAQQDSAALAAGGVQLTVVTDVLLTAGDIVTVKCASAGTTTWDTACRAWIHRIG